MNRLTEIALDSIERQSFWSAYSAKEIEHAVGLISFTPEFVTRAEAGLREADKALTTALERIRKARKKLEQRRNGSDLLRELRQRCRGKSKEAATTVAVRKVSTSGRSRIRRPKSMG